MLRLLIDSIGIAKGDYVNCSVNKAIAQAVVENNLNTMFGLLGDANLFMAQSFVDDCGGRFVAATHEAGAVLMALGHALITGKTGLASVTHGPGLSNTLTALIDGVKGRIPLLLLCGDTAAEARDHFQNVNQRELVLATGAGFVQVRSAATVVEDLLQALRAAHLERRPVVLNIPADLGWETCSYVPSLAHYGYQGPFKSAGEQLDNAIGIIAAARSPIVLAGRGAIAAESEAALLRLAERTGALLATTLKGKGLFHGDDYNLGVFGGLSTPVANELILQSDCVIAFGASLNKWTSANGSLLAGKRVIQCNLEPGDLGVHCSPDAVLMGDPVSTVSEILYWLDEAEIPASAFRSEEIRQQIASCDTFAGLANTATQDTVDLTRSLLRLNEVIPGDRIVVTDIGRFVGQAWKALDVTRPGSFIHTVNFGSIGLGPGYAIGASIGSPDRPTVLVVGDGGFMLGGVAEFHTAVREGADLIVIVCNDGSYGSEHVQYEARNISRELSLFGWPEFSELARSLGGSGVAVRNLAELELACQAVSDRHGPLLIDLKLDPTTMIPLDY
ncbi:thiamine pyrophosphate-binding protein [Congregibacter sp.]|jgi:acetolactate synthase-1/2/3 large subunit|uniref:thiamine pyrophosphate-binding protein n=1 Tax=Congregibacter sp. TaxID=2744308 RepID=UPI0039E66EE4